MTVPVPWVSYPGEYLEAAMAVYVAQEAPGTLRRTPASGDGGIDLMIPKDEGFEVHQIKSFTGRIGASQRRQIQDSWRSVVENPRLSKPIVAYALVVPVDPTPDEQAWFEDLVKDAPWPVRWLGKVHWDSLASQFPHVTDYYFGGGKQLVIDRGKTLFGIGADPTKPLTAIDVATSVAVLQVGLNRADPHYRFDLLTTPSAPSETVPPGYVFQRSERLQDGSYLSIRVWPKHRYALEDSPIQGRLSIEIADPAQASVFQEAFEAFTQFGRPLEIPDGALTGSFTAPGGLGGSLDGGGGWIGPVPSQQERPPLRLSLLDEHGEAIEDLIVEFVSVTTGPAGGSELILRDRTEILMLTLQIDPPVSGAPGPLTLHISTTKPQGRAVVDVVQAMRLLAHLHQPNKLLLRHRITNKVVAEAAVNHDKGLLSVSLYNHLDDLAFVQQYADEPILYPEQVDSQFAAELAEYVRMLKGEVVVNTWTDSTVSLNVPRSELPAPLAAEGALVIEHSVSVTIDAQDVELGRFSRVVHSAQLAADQPENEREARFVPGSDDRYTYRLGCVVPTDGP